MKLNSKNKYFIITGVILVSFFFVSFFGFNVGVGEENGQMIGCPYKADSAGMCPMAFREHLIQWSLLFSAMTPEVGFINVFAAGFVLFLAFLLLSVGKQKKYQIHTSRGDPVIRTLLPLLRSLRRGIMHPKLFA